MPEPAKPTPLQAAFPAPLSPKDRLIVALDFPAAGAALECVRNLGGSVGAFKVGLELFTAAGPAFVQELVADGHRVFLDLKFHDIPNTVAGAVRSASALGVHMLTIHAAGGPAMVRAAVEAAQSANRPPLVLAVTVLTSMGPQDLSATGVGGDPAEQVLRLASMAQAAGCPGIVASPLEVQALRRQLGPGLRIVTPGIRPAGFDAGDQQRIATPADAVANGADYLVVGRPITQAGDPKGVADAIVKQMGG